VIFTEQVESRAEVNELSKETVNPFLKLTPEEALFEERTNAQKNEKRNEMLQKTMIS